MSNGSDANFQITPDILLKAYASGIFPMADSADDPDIYWVEPALRGILPLEEFHLPRRLKRTIRSDRFTVRIDTDFENVIEGCAGAAPGRRSTWINAKIRQLFGELFRLGHVHTVETWRDGRLVGGLYGLHLGSAFFGESMFSHETDASKVAFVHLVARLKHGGFRLLDTQFVTDHLTRFGVVEIPRSQYHLLLDDALQDIAEFRCFDQDWSEPDPVPVSGNAVLQLVNQTS
ncbi:MAG TPA: leucyl/phenylalanyl-tRNA--protein transferase [Afifellaceae bacterium]|nr:leucyl/phenylalanyl-tRNA--protein transferase [Afifellaceae bacterium]